MGAGSEKGPDCSQPKRQKEGIGIVLMGKESHSWVLGWGMGNGGDNPVCILERFLFSTPVDWVLNCVSRITAFKFPQALEHPINETKPIMSS